MSGFKFMRPIDTANIRILGILHLVNGLYLIGPWYISTTTGGDDSPLFVLFGSVAAVKVFGSLLIIQATALLLTTVMGYRKVLEWSLLSGFLLSLYSLIGVLSAMKWLPPTYVSQAATVLILGAYWVWTRRNGRPAQ